MNFLCRIYLFGIIFCNFVTLNDYVISTGAERNGEISFNCLRFLDYGFAFARNDKKKNII